MRKTLRYLLERYPDKIDEVNDESRSGDGYWLYLKPGWARYMAGEVHCVHEWNMADLKEGMKEVVPCDCDDCKDRLAEQAGEPTVLPPSPETIEAMDQHEEEAVSYGDKMQQARAVATARYLAVANALKVEAGVKRHTVRNNLSGRAQCATGHITAPEGRTRKQLYILAHECAHILLHNNRGAKPRHVEEMEAEKWAHEALRRHGVSVPRSMTQRAKRYVARKLDQAHVRGARTLDAEALRYAGLKRAQFPKIRKRRS